MCAISGSFDLKKLKQLYHLNTYRGELSYSFSVMRPEKSLVKLQILMQDEGKLPNTFFENTTGIPTQEGDYYISHSQAPTTESKNIHPAVYGDAMLWHNGIIKQKTMSEGTWDTLWLMERILDYGWSSLSRIDGTFACVMFWGSKLYVFRNEISPLFIDKDLNISSTKEEGFDSLKPNIVFKMDLQKKKLIEEAYFTTFENPYYIPEL